MVSKVGTQPPLPRRGRAVVRSPLLTIQPIASSLRSRKPVAFAPNDVWSDNRLSKRHVARDPTSNVIRPILYNASRST